MKISIEILIVFIVLTICITGMLMVHVRTFDFIWFMILWFYTVKIMVFGDE